MNRSRRRQDAVADMPGSEDAPTPSVVRSWLVQTAQGSAAPRVEGLAAVLDKLRIGSLPAESRFVSIELCREELTTARRELEGSLDGLSLPLHPDKEKLSRRWAEIYWLLSACYLRVASDIVSADDGRGDARQLLRSRYWGIASLAEHLFINYKRYAKPRQGVWLDIHRLYNIAQSEGVHDAPVFPGSNPVQTVEHIYKRVLLLGLSGPYRHSLQGLTQIHEHLDAWAPLAFFASTVTDPGRGVFIVDPALDRPAMPALSRSRIRPEFNERWLVTRELVDALKRQYRKAEKEAVPRIRQESMTEELDSLELVRRLIVSWGLHPIRSTTRTRTRKRCEVITGVNSVCVALHALRSGTDGTPTVFISKFKEWLDARGVEARPEDLAWHWEIVDESERGLRFIVDDSKSGITSVGELIAFRARPSGPWRPGHIHWAQTDDQGRLSLGIRRIEAQAEPVLIGRLSEGLPASARNPGLLLVRESDNRRTVSLLCDKSLYLPTSTYRVYQSHAADGHLMEPTSVLLHPFIRVVRSRQGAYHQPP